MQLAIATEELPHVADAIRQPRDNERANDLNGARFLRLYDAQTPTSTPTPDTVKALVKAMEVGKAPTPGPLLGHQPQVWQTAADERATS